MVAPVSGEKKSVLERWSRLSLRSKGVVVLSVPLTALFLALFAVYEVEGNVDAADRAVGRFYEIRAELVQIRSSLGDAEAAARGYLATGQRDFQVTFDQARGSVTRSLDHLGQLSTGDPAATAALQEIRRPALAGLRTLGDLRELAAAEAVARATALDRARSSLGDAEARVALLSAQEERQFGQARFEREMARQKLFRTVMACGVLGPLGALFMHLLISGRLVRRIRLVEENARRLAHGWALEPFPRGSDEISALADQIENAAYLLRKREREVKENEQRYRDLFDRAPIPFEETDCDGAVRRFNQAVCNLLKCSPDQVLGRKAWDFVAPDQQEGFRSAMMERIRLGTEAGAFECDYMLEDGSRITVEVRENLVRDERSQVTGVVRSLLDVTERNLAAVAARKVSQYAMELRNKNEQLARALEAARSATEAKSRFLASVSHELRTPLNGIIGFSELMHDGKLGAVTEEHKDALTDILTSARHLLQLINDILDLSKVEAGRMEFRPEPSRIETLVYEVRDVVRPLAERKRLNLLIDVPGDLTAVIDPSRFKQVLYNYLSNAVKFTPDSGRVEVRITREAGSSFRLEVEDTGIGISAAEVSQLFQEFQQLPNSRKADQGTGLGLALTRHIVEAQGGSVSVRSVPGRGSVFSAVLPLVSVPTPVGAHR